MTKCSKRRKIKIMSFVMALSLIVNLIGSSITVSAQENGVDFEGYEAPLDEQLEDVSGDSEPAGDENMPKEDSSEQSESTDGEKAAAGELPEDSETEDGKAAPEEDASGDFGVKEGEELSGDGSPLENEAGNTPEDGTGTDEAVQPSEELASEAGESSVEEAVQEKAEAAASGEDVIAGGTTNHIEWKIDKNGKLSITGSGDYELDSEEHTPWYAYREAIKAAQVNVTGLTSAEMMFLDCADLKSLDLSGFDTSHVTNMDFMFSGCRQLESLDLSNFDTSNVTSMFSLFCDCENLKELDLSKFNTGSVTNMSGMFSGCGSLKELDLSKFDTSNVTDMYSMFSGCGSLKELDLSKFDTRNVVYMFEMFNGCGNLKELDLSKFDTSNVTSMYKMFSDCGSLKELDLSKFNTSNVQSTFSMFEGCSSLTSLDLGSFDMKKVSYAVQMFNGANELMYIRAPKHCTIDIELPAGDDTETWYQGVGEPCTILPKNLDSSIELYKNGYPGDGTTKRIAYISGVSMEDKVYDGKPDTYVGTAVVKDAEGNELTDITVSYSYQGMLKDGSQYAKTQQAPAQAGTYTLLVAAENDTYIGKMLYRFNILEKEISVSADSVTINTGGRLPELSELTYTIDGLLGTDKLTKEPQFKYNAKYLSTAEAGSYEIIPYGAEAGNNYSIQYVNGTLTIEAGGDQEKQHVSISGIAIEDKIYDGAPITYTGDLLVKDAEGNTVTDIIPSYAYTGTLADGSAYAENTQAPAQAGSYTLTVATAENDKYAAVTSIYNFTIKKKEATITAQSVIMKTGGQLPGLNGLTYDVTGLIEGDSLAVQPRFRYSAENISADAEGSYDIIPYGADAGNNYSVTYVNAVLKIEASAGSPPYEDKDDSSYPDEERIDLNAVSVQIAKIKPKTYDITTRYEPTVKVTVLENGKKKTLTEGTDYRVLYDNNQDAGTEALAIVRGNGIYKGEFAAKFTINPKPIKKLKIITGNVTDSISAADIADLSLPVYVYDGGTLLTRGEDYNLSLKASTAKVITLNVEAVANTNYTGTSTAKLNIYSGVDGAKLINPENVYLGTEGTAYTEFYETPYTGKALKPAVTVKIGETTLTNNNYKVAYQNNKDAGTAYVIVTGKGEYKGKAVVPFHIMAKESEFTITNVIKDKTYNGKLQKPAVTVKAGSVKLKKGKDYIVTYADNLHAGKATITVTGKGNYIGTATKPFNINKQNIKKVSVKANNQSGVIDVSYGKRLLRKDSDYTLEYGAQKGNNKVEVTVTATDESDFTGSMTKTVKVPVYIPVLKEADQTIEKGVGETYQLTFEEPESQAAVIGSVEYESSNPEVASVDNNGLITTKKAGAVVIKVYANNRKSVQQCFVIVKGDEELPEGRGITYNQAPGTMDDTQAINAILQTWEYNPSYCDYVYIPAGVYRIDAVDGGIGIGGIILRDNQTLIMSPSALIMAIGNKAANSQVIYAFGRENVTISGGQIIGERETHTGKGGEWGHGISIQGCTNVHISNMDISKCWGDGICLGEYDMRNDEGKLIHKPSNEITIENCTLHHNRRNNLSITDANNVTINHCQFNYAKGTDPQYGICIEYNYTPTENVEIYNSTFTGNAKASMGIIKKATNVRLENCTLDGNFYNMAGKNVVLKNTTIKGEIVDKTGIRKE